MMPVRSDGRDAAVRGAAWTGWLRAVALTAALSACGVAQWYIAHGRYWTETGPLLIAAALLTALLLGRPAAEADRWAPPSPPAASYWPALALAAIGGAIFIFASYQLSFDWMRRFDVAAPLIVAGVALWSAGLALWESARRPARKRLAFAGWEWWLFLAIVALGFFLRFYRYGHFPPPDGVCAVEEPQAGQIPFGMMQEHSRPWEFVGDRWLGVVGFALFGRNLTALRIPFTLVSALTVIAVYLLLRELVSRPAALFTTALFAMCRWHLIYARYAHNIFATTLVVVVIYYLMIRAHKGGGLSLYPWIGFLSGYTLYTYAGYRGTVLFVVFFFAISMLVRRRAQQAAVAPQAHAAAQRRLHTEVAGLALAAVAFLGALVPLAMRLRTDPSFFFEAAYRATNDPGYYTQDRAMFIRQVEHRVRVTALLFNHVGDGSATFNLPNRPMLDPISGLLLTLGLSYCLIWGRNRWQGYFAFTFLVVLLMGTVFVHNFDPRRLQGVIPLIFVLAAFVVDRFWQVAVGGLGPRVRPVLVLTAIAALVVAFRDNYNVYFRGMMEDPAVRSVFQNPGTIGLRYLHQLPRNAYMLMFSDTLNFFMPNDYEWWRAGTVPGKVTADLLPVLNGEPGPWAGRELHLFIADPFEHDDVARMLHERFPDSRCARLTDPDIPAHLHFSACLVPPAAARAPLRDGVRARYFRGDATAPLLERVEPAIGYALFPDVCSYPLAREKPPCHAEWEGTWEVPEAGLFRVQAEARNGTISMTVDDRRVDTKPLDLTAGPHVVRVSAQFRSVEDAGAQVRLLRDGRWELLRFTSLPPVTPGS